MNDLLFFSLYESPIGLLTLCAKPDALISLHFGKRDDFTSTEENGILAAAHRQLEEYFSGARRAFDLPLAPKGTPFQQKVWQALTEIPYGETRSYQQIAAAAGNMKACRAVGMANNRNPISIIIPCHRVIGKGGSLVGYGGGLPIKEQLLALEQRHL